MKLAFAIKTIFFALFTTQASGQAPGDHDVSCRTGINAADHQFAAEWNVLLDSFDYQDLFATTASVWVTSDVDGDDLDWTQIGGVCSRSMRPCTGEVSQNNWLFSQHVRYEDAKEVFFQVSYRFIECQGTCIRPYVTLYQYNSDDLATNANRINPSNYEPLFGDEESSRFVQPTGVSRVQEVTRTITRPANSDGFYLGIRDEGTCGSISRLIVYYVVCPTRVDGLVTYPEFGVPERTSADIPFEAQCASNAHNITSLQVIAFSSNSSCSPVAPGGAVCECDGGYVLSNDGLSCEACPAGQYRALSGSTCEDCPANTQTDEVAASLCSCNNGFYRRTSPLEGPGMGCTEPPSECTNLQVLSTTDTTIIVSWSRPATIGRGDYFYMVSHSDPSNLGVLITVEEELVDSGSTVTYTVTGLLPFTPYMVLVSTHNGVSAQDPDNANSRQCDITTMTMEGAPGRPTNVQYLCTVVVWQPPAQPNGNIIRYDIQFSTGQPKAVDSGDSFYITTAEEQTSGTNVRVRAVNGAGNGVWTAYQDVGCASSGSNCPTQTCDCPEPLPELHFTLGGTVYLNNTVVVVDDIGAEENGLACKTTKEGCCRTDRLGHFYFPNGAGQLSSSGEGGDFYRNREDTGIVRLNRRNGATSPLGAYTCEIPDANGVLQNLTINLVDSTPDAPTTCPETSCTEQMCPTTPPTEPVTCPDVVTCPTPLPCSVVTCPTPLPCPTLGTCPTPPPLSCPTPASTECACDPCPTTTTTTTITPPLYFTLGGAVYLNNTVVVVDDIGAEENGLACKTTKEVCCRAGGLGNFYFPNGMQLSSSGGGGDFYRDREDTGIVRLNRRNGATSPLGVYTCEIPDVNGVLQYLTIELVPSRVSTCPDPTCNECPPCPATQPPTTCTECPVVSCPATQPPTTCTECPDVSCPTTQPPTTCTEPPIHFVLGGTTYLNNTVVMVEAIGEEVNGLACVTTKAVCCREDRLGNFYFPNGMGQLSSSGGGEDIYRDREDTGIVRLNRRNGATSPLGTYRCEIPDANGVLQNLYITLVSKSQCSNTSTAAMRDIIETENSFIGALESAAESNTMQMILNEISRVKRQISSIMIEVEVTPGSYLVVIPKSKLENLIRGRVYEFRIKQFPNRTAPFIFEYREDIPRTSSQAEQNSNLIPYIVATAIVGVVLTAIVAGLIMACIIYCVIRQYKKRDLDVLKRYTYKNTDLAKDSNADKNHYSPTKNNEPVEMNEKI